MAKASTPVRNTRPTATQAKGSNRGRTPRVRTPDVLPLRMPFERSNVIYILLGFGVVVLGYALMAMGATMSFVSLTLAPIVLVLGYFIVIPYGILYGSKSLRNRKELIEEDKSV